MGRRPKWGRPINGVLLLNKDGGMTSNSALQQAKRLFHAKRAGHTGSLDPLATGVLPLCFGEATKFSQYLLDADKCYLSTFRFGIQTETGDCDGDVVLEKSASHITRASIEEMLPAFTGKIMQMPSMYSALKYQGKPLYKWAREGVELPIEARPSREVTVYQYEIKAFRTAAEMNSEFPEVDVLVHCSKGTYIRTLAEDLGDKLDCGAHVIRLHRQMAGPFSDKEALHLGDLQEERGEAEPESLDHHLLPLDAPIEQLPLVNITNDMGAYFCQGQPVMSMEAYRIAEEGGMVRVYSEDGQFLGVGELFEGNIAPKRIVNY
ncbi:MAG: tRNA pseudouridine(55) synthase TruB [Cellvibrionaceae bacterium]